MESKNIKTILICSIHQMYRETLAQAILSVTSNYKIVDTVGEVEQAHQHLTNSNIDYLLINLDRIGINPFNYIQTMQNKFPKTKLIVLTFWDHFKYNNDLLKSGASFYYVISQKIDVLIKNLDKDIFDRKKIPRMLTS